MMKKPALAFVLFLMARLALAQTGKSQLEIMPSIRHDDYPRISYHFKGREEADALSMKGLSWGTNINYKYLLGKNFRLKAGAGYYRYTFSDITSSNKWGTTNARPIDGVTNIPIEGYPDGEQRIYYTDRYWYNTLSLNVGLEKSFPLSSTLDLFTSVNISDYYTLSQVYHMDETYFTTTFEQAPTGSREWKHETREKEHFGYSAFLQLGLAKKAGGFSLAPSLLLPVFDSWRKDELFREGGNGRDTRSKNFGGVGLALAISRNL